MKTIFKKEFEFDSKVFEMAVVLVNRRPLVQVSQLFEPERHVRAVSVVFPVKTTEGGISFVEEATRDDLDRALKKMAPLLEGAERIQGYLVKYNKPPARKINYDSYVKHKRFR